ncbi:WD repeat-containing protein 47, partial [Perkinsus olseni]
EYFRSVVMAGRWGDVLRLVTKLYSSATAAEQRAAQFRVYRQEFLELLFLTEGDEEDSRGANGPLVEKAMVGDMAQVLKKIKPLCSKTEYAELYEALTAPSLEEYRQGWQSKAGGRYGLWRSYVPKLMEVYGKSGWAECGMVTPGCCKDEDTLDDLVALGLRHKYIQSPQTNRATGSPQVPSDPAVLQKLGEPTREVGQTEELQHSSVGQLGPEARSSTPTPDRRRASPNHSGVKSGEAKPAVFPKGVRIDIPWDTEIGHGSAERSSGAEEAVRDSRQISVESGPEWQWDPSESRLDASRAIVESSGPYTEAPSKRDVGLLHRQSNASSHGQATPPRQ